MIRRGRRAVPPVPENEEGNGDPDAQSETAAITPAAVARAESLRADLAGIANRIGGLSGSATPAPPPLTSELIEGLDRLVALAGPGFATIDELRLSVQGIVDETAAANAARGDELGRAIEALSARFDMVAVELDQRQQRHLADISEQNQIRSTDFSTIVELVGSKMDRLTEIAEPVPAELERLRQGQGRIDSETADALLAVNAMDDRLRKDNQESTAEILTTLQRLSATTTPGFEMIEELRHSWDELLSQASASSAERGEELGRAVDLAADRFGAMLATSSTERAEDLSRAVDLASDRFAAIAAASNAVRSEELERAVEAATTRFESILARSGVEHAHELSRAVEAAASRFELHTGIANSQRDGELDRIAQANSARLEALLADIDQRHHRHLAEFSEQSDARIGALQSAIDGVATRLDHLADLAGSDPSDDARLAAFQSAIDGIGTRLDHLTGLAEPVTGELERIREEQGRLGADSAIGAALAVEGLDERLRTDREESGRELTSRLDRLTALTEAGFQGIEELQSSQDRISARVIALDGLLAEQEKGRLAGIPGTLEQVRLRLDHLTEVAETVLPLPGALERLRTEQDRLAAQMDTALVSIVEAGDQFRQGQQPLASDIFERIGRVGLELEDASDRLRETAEQIAHDREDSRGQMATLDLGLRVALTGMEAVVNGRHNDQVSQLKDAQREVVESVLQGLARFGRQVDDGLQQATEELTTSVFLTHEDSDERSRAMQDGLTKALARVEDSEHDREQQLVDLRRVVDRLAREVQLLRPAIDLRAAEDHNLLNGVALDRFAGRVASLLSGEVLARLDGNSTNGPNGHAAIASPSEPD